MASDLARRAFASMSDEGGGDDAGPSMDAGAVAGRKFAQALGLKDIDGMKVKMAFKALMDECQAYEAGEADEG